MYNIETDNVFVRAQFTLLPTLFYVTAIFNASARKEDMTR
jgi:hypothetical protein